MSSKPGGWTFIPTGIAGQAPIPLVDDLSRNAITGAQLLLLIGLIADAQLDGQELEQFLAGARKFADQLMS